MFADDLSALPVTWTARSDIPIEWHNPPPLDELPLQADSEDGRGVQQHISAAVFQSDGIWLTGRSWSIADERGALKWIGALIDESRAVSVTVRKDGMWGGSGLRETADALQLHAAEGNIVRSWRGTYDVGDDLRIRW